jgi:hypothetical protein
MMRVKMPPAVSTRCSAERRPEEARLHRSVDDAALQAGADSHVFVRVDTLVGLFAKKASTLRCTSGMRVCPPTRMTWVMSAGVSPASLSAWRQGSSVSLTKVRNHHSNSSRENRGHQVLRACVVDSQKRQVDIGSAEAERLHLWPSRRLP